MYQANIKTSQHVWEKQNLITLSKNGRMFDEMLCKNCGMKGRRYNFEFVEVSETYKYENVHSCPKATQPDIPKKIEVINCRAVGKAFKNLEPGTIHDVVTPPTGYKNDHTGVWVMGVSEPVKLLTGEFTPIKNI
jgi:hypothetical protein